MWKLAEDTLDQDDLDSLAEWLRRGPRLTQGPLVREFEDAWSDWLGSGHSVMVSSGTTANFALMAVVARRLAPRKPRVGVSAVTWSTNVTPSVLLNHEIVVFDVEPGTLGIDRELACRAMEAGEIDILFVTHLLGLCAIDAELLSCAEQNGVIVLEDCCESHGARYGDRKAGTLGLASTFSFYFGHHMSTIEGGIVSTDDADLADELRLMRAHGLARESSAYAQYAERYGDLDPRFLFVSPGLNFRSTDLNAFLGLRQLRMLDNRIEQRNRNMSLFLESAPSWLWRDYRTDGMSSFALPLIVDDQDMKRAITAVVDRLGIESRPVVAGNLLKQPFLQGHHLSVFNGRTPIADQIHRYGIYVGNGHHVSPGMIEELCSRIGEIE